MSEWTIQFEHPVWLAGLTVWVPVVLLGLRSLSGLGRWRQRGAIALRMLVLGLLFVLLAEPMRAKKFDKLSVVAVMDMSRSVPEDLRAAGLAYLNEAAKGKPGEDRIGVIYAGESPHIHSLPNVGFTPVEGKSPLAGDRTDLAAAVRIAMAVLPGDTAKRIVLVSDGNENMGDLRGVARMSRANTIPIDVLSLNYDHKREVIFERLIVPQNARMGQTISAKCVIRSTAATAGKLILEDNGKVIDLDPDTEGVAIPVALKSGLNVLSVQLPIRSGGIHRFRAEFAAEDAASDTLAANNTGMGVSFVIGRGRVLVMDGDGESAGEILRVLGEARVEAEYRPAGDFPPELVDLLEYDSVVLVNAANSFFSLAQQEMMVRYVHDLGGGLVMVGGPDGFGAGGWIGSPVEEALPVVLDPPQKQQMPKGALALIMHSVEMPQGNYWGKVVAATAAKALSRLDLVGVIDYDWQQGTSWVYPLSPAGDKENVLAAIEKMQMGDMPDFGSGVGLAYNALTACDAAQKHIILISDGDPSPPSKALLDKLVEAGITATGVAVYPHSPADVKSLQYIAQKTGGRFYNVTDPNTLPQIFVKETKVVRRPLIWEKTFVPKVADVLSELAKGIELTVPKLDGYVLTGEKKELVENVMVSPEGDPVLACRQYGLGRTVAFTSDATGRWAGSWLGWERFGQFWEQVVRWSMRSGESPNFQVSTELDGEKAYVVVEAAGEERGFSNFLDIGGVVIDPMLKASPVQLRQVGPGRYLAEFPVRSAGNYVVNLNYADGQTKGTIRGALAVPFAPEFTDLRNNPALLSEVAEISGGRKLAGDAAGDKLFDHAELAFPFERKPLWQELGLLWLMLFLADVAVRRVVLDFGAMKKGLARFFARFRKSGREQATVSELRKRQLEVRERFRKVSDRQTARRRFEMPESFDGCGQADVPTAGTKPTTKPAAPEPKKEDKPAKAEDPSGNSYLDRLKQAKNKAKKNMEE